jgi:hypothetical protein
MPTSRTAHAERGRVREHTCKTTARQSLSNQSSTSQSWTESLLLRKRNPRLHTQHVGWLICGSPSSFSPTLNQRSSGESQASVDGRLLGLPGPYHRHAIGTFNTCSRGLTHWSLTNTGGGYNLGGASFPYTTLRPSQPMVSTFHLRAPPGLQFNHFLQEIPKLSLRTLWPPRVLSTTRPSTVTYIYA